MNERDREATSSTTDNVGRGGEDTPAKRRYRRPSIRDYGSVGQLTAGASGMGSDGGGGMFNN
jgi:hypothetical protein